MKQLIKSLAMFSIFCAGSIFSIHATFGFRPPSITPPQRLVATIQYNKTKTTATNSYQKAIDKAQANFIKHRNPTTFQKDLAEAKNIYDNALKKAKTDYYRLKQGPIRKPTQKPIARPTQISISLLDKLPANIQIRIKSHRNNKYYAARKIDNVWRLVANANANDKATILTTLRQKNIIGFKSAIADNNNLQSNPSTKEVRFENKNFYLWEYWYLIGTSLTDCYLKSHSTKGYLSNRSGSESWNTTRTDTAWTRDQSGRPAGKSGKEKIAIEIVKSASVKKTEVKPIIKPTPKPVIKPTPKPAPKPKPVVKTTPKPVGFEAQFKAIKTNLENQAVVMVEKEPSLATWIKDFNLVIDQILDQPNPDAAYKKTKSLATKANRWFTHDWWKDKPMVIKNKKDLDTLYKRASSKPKPKPFDFEAQFKSVKTNLENRAIVTQQKKPSLETWIKDFNRLIDNIGTQSNPEASHKKVQKLVTKAQRWFEHDWWKNLPMVMENEKNLSNLYKRAAKKPTKASTKPIEKKITKPTPKPIPTPKSLTFEETFNKLKTELRNANAIRTRSTLTTWISDFNKLIDQTPTQKDPSKAQEQLKTLTTRAKRYFNHDLWRSLPVVITHQAELEKLYNRTEKKPAKPVKPKPIIVKPIEKKIIEVKPVEKKPVVKKPAIDHKALFEKAKETISFIDEKGKKGKITLYKEALTKLTDKIPFTERLIYIDDHLIIMVQKALTHEKIGNDIEKLKELIELLTNAKGQLSQSVTEAEKKQVNEKIEPLIKKLNTKTKAIEQQGALQSFGNKVNAAKVQVPYASRITTFKSLLSEIESSPGKKGIYMTAVKELIENRRSTQLSSLTNLLDEIIGRAQWDSALKEANFSLDELRKLKGTASKPLAYKDIIKRVGTRLTNAIDSKGQRLGWIADVQYLANNIAGKSKEDIEAIKQLFTQTIHGNISWNTAWYSKFTPAERTSIKALINKVKVVKVPVEKKPAEKKVEAPKTKETKTVTKQTTTPKKEKIVEKKEKIVKKETSIKSKPYRIRR